MFTVVQSYQTKSGLDVSVVDEDGNIIAWFFSFDIAMQFVSAMNNYMPDVHGNARCTNCCDGI